MFGSLLFGVSVTSNQWFSLPQGDHECSSDTSPCSSLRPGHRGAASTNAGRTVFLLRVGRKPTTASSKFSYLQTGLLSVLISWKLFKP